MGIFFFSVKIPYAIKTCHYNCHNNMIAVPNGKLVVLQDLENYLVADTDNVLLVCKKDNEGVIRKYVNDVQVKLGDNYI